jgi:hypothetical protein
MAGKTGIDQNSSEYGMDGGEKYKRLTEVRSPAQNGCHPHHYTTGELLKNFENTEKLMARIDEDLYLRSAGIRRIQNGKATQEDLMVNIPSYQR